ncbi:molybdopterin converting factor subunit 1 [Psychrobacillus sp. INOP01]|uniref:molybdopterin converting factor subunit 1 n=1 Tax=Psychrobacillus sp. INOP01 TaxID=2829187 RepID=UPI001BAC521D|nr:molybdopterin converting factor subunit 1 [Psychrobacillus sp. INOP01]QUG41513.1 molybdopterin converting factor subunit 1 [Psychrobacillus sp. INOP01]
MITVLYFAGLKEKTGTDKEEFVFSGKTVKQLLEELQRKYEGLADGIIQVAINEEYALLDDIIHERDTIALIPPVSGG